MKNVDLTVNLNTLSAADLYDLEEELQEEITALKDIEPRFVGYQYAAWESEIGRRRAMVETIPVILMMRAQRVQVRKDQLSLEDSEESNE